LDTDRTLISNYSPDESEINWLSTESERTTPTEEVVAVQLSGSPVLDQSTEKTQWHSLIGLARAKQKHGIAQQWGRGIKGGDDSSEKDGLLLL